MTRSKGLDTLRALRRKQRCEACERESDTLVPLGGKWLCGSCALAAAQPQSEPQPKGNS